MPFPVLVGEVIAGQDIGEPIMPWPKRIQRAGLWLATLGIRPSKDQLHILAACDSGAEALLAWQFAQHATPDVDNHRFTGDAIVLRPQAPARKYRVDLLASSRGYELAIEVDGMEWHHATEEQVQGDYLRQRRLTAMGYSVIRFTAREVYRDPAECWRQVEAILEENG